MSYKLKGKVKIVQDAQTFGSGFTKREVIITVEEGKYPQDISLACVQDKVSLLDSVGVGAEVEADFNIQGREHNGRYFNNLICWKLSVLSAGASVAPPESAPPEQTPAVDDEDIPF